MSSRYEFREAIGHGGLGSVYKAFDTQLQREVAVKRVLTTGQGTPEEIEAAGKKLISEAQTLSSLNHPNIITVFDVGTDEKGGFVVMELLKGETLDETVERGVLTTDDFTEVVYQTMEALIAAQDKNVIHRDIKPTNIMLIWQASGKFQLKILDFGLAKFSKNPSVQTMDQDDAVMGSIFFMAPEQFERGELDARTDLYQMGCVYYNALTGQYPFNGQTAPQVMNAHLQHKVVPIEQIRPDLPPALAQWVMWLINRDISTRPASAKEALKYFPKDTGATPAIPVAVAAPTPTTQSQPIRVATPEGRAAAPPNLIVTGNSTTTLRSTGTSTGMLQSGSSTAAPARTASAAAQKKDGGIKGTTIVSIVGGLIALLLGGYIFWKNQTTKQNLARLEELYKAEAPSASGKDAKILVRLMTSGDDHAQKSEAYQTLKKVKGSDIDPVLLENLENTDSTIVRKQFATLLSNRGYKPALKTIMSYSNSAKESKDKLAFLIAAKPLATTDNLNVFLDGLKSTQDLSIRSVYEDTLLSIVRSSSDPEEVLKQIRVRIKSASGGERRSLFKVLGSVGDDQTVRLLEQTFLGNDLSMKQDALSAYLAWPTREPIDKVTELISDANTPKALKIPAEAAYIELAAKPGPVTIGQRIQDWQKGFELLEKNPSGKQKLMQKLIEFPHQRTVGLLATFKEDQRFGRLATAISESITKSLERMKAHPPGETIKGTAARVQGSDAGANRFLESISTWTSPSTHFTWNIKIKEGGDYKVSVLQADLNDKASDFVVYLNGETLKGKSMQTTSYESFKPVDLSGSVSLQAGEVYQLTLMAGENTQPRMMDIGGVVLKK